MKRKTALHLANLSIKPGKESLQEIYNIINDIKSFYMKRRKNT